MAGLNKNHPGPTNIVVHQKSRRLDIEFDDGRAFSLPFEYLRVYSPSAEVRGHGPGQETLQVGKRHVGIQAVASVGHYAIQPQFDDGHDTGIFSWDYLYWLGDQQDALWSAYLAKLEEAGASRDQEGASADASVGGPDADNGDGLPSMRATDVVRRRES